MPTLYIQPDEKLDFQLKAGDKLRYTRTVYTVGNKSYQVGDMMELLERTDENPHGFVEHDGKNWAVKCKHFPRSIWSSIPYAVKQGWLELV